MHDAREIADLLRDLRLVAEVGDAARRRAGVTNEQRARAGESGEVADVGQAGEQQAVEVRRGEAVDERGDATRGVGQLTALRPFSVATRPRSASS